MGQEKDISEHIRDVEREYPDTDVVAYSGPILRPFDDDFMSLCEGRALRQNLILILNTPGGDTDAAYRMARCVQRRWGLLALVHDGPRPNVSVFVDTVCGSAGALLALGATDLIMSENAELRPLDIHPGNLAGASERTPSLTSSQALDILERRFKDLFKEHYTHLRQDNDLELSARLAIEMSSSAAGGLLAAVYGQFDPVRLAEADRQMATTAGYGERLSKFNLKPGALNRLLTGYPSHRFVIDKSEAEELFQSVLAPKPGLKALAEHLRRAAQAGPPDQRPVTLFLTGSPHVPEMADDHVPLQPTAAAAAPVALAVANDTSEPVERKDRVREAEGLEAILRRPASHPQSHAKRGSIEEKVAAVWHNEIYA
jgi:hypothetical protein